MEEESAQRKIQENLAGGGGKSNDVVEKELMKCSKIPRRPYQEKWQTVQESTE